MAGTIKRLAGPAYLGASVANVYNNGDSSLYTIIRHIHVANTTGAAVQFSLYLGATGASTGGTELVKLHSIAANSEFDFYDALRLASTDFITGNATAGSSLVITITGELAVV